MASLFLFDKTGEELEFPIGLDASEVKIGRSTGNDLRIRAPSISRNHASLLIQNGQYFLQDGGSSNGTYINGKRLAPNRPYPVALGDQLKFGEVLVRFEEPGMVPSPTRPPPPTSSPVQPQPAPPAAGAPPQPPPAQTQPPPPWQSGPLPAPPPPRIEPPRPRPTLESGLDLSHMLNQPQAPPVAAAGKPDPLAGLFDDLPPLDFAKRSPSPAEAVPPAPPRPRAEKRPLSPPEAAPVLPPLPRPGEGPLEISLDELLGDEPEGKILEVDDATGMQGVLADSLDRLFELDGPPAPAPAPAPAPTPAPAPHTAPFVPPFAAPFAAPPAAPAPAPAPAARAPEEPRPPLPEAAELPAGLFAMPESPSVAAPQAAGSATTADLQLASIGNQDPAGLLHRVAELEEELESRKGKIDSLQKAARRDVEAKKKLQDEKTDLEVQLASLRGELEQLTGKLEEEDRLSAARLEEERSLGRREGEEKILALEVEVARANEELSQQGVAHLEEKSRLEQELQRQALAHEEEKAAALEQLLAGAGQAERREIQRLQGRVEEVEELLAEATAEVERLTREQERLQGENETLHGLLEHEQEKVQATELHTAAVRAELEEAASERDSLILHVEELEESLASRPSEQQLALLQRDLTSLQRELEGLRESSSRRIAEYMGHIDAMLAEKRTLEAEAVAAQGTIDELSRELAETRQANLMLQEQLAALPDAAEIAELELELVELRRSADAGEQRLRQLEAELEASHQQLEDFKGKARQTFQDLAKEIGGLEEDLERAQTEQEGARQLEQELQEQQAELQAALRRKEREQQEQAAALQTELRTMQQRAEQRFKEQKEQIVALEAELDQAQEIMADEGKRASSRYEEMRRKHEEAQQLVQELQDELAGRPTREQHEQLQQRSDKLELTVNQLEEELTQQELQNRESTKSLRRISGELEEAKLQQERLGQQLAGIRQRLEETEAEKGRLAEMLRMQQTDDVRAALQTELDVLRAKLASREEDLQELRTTAAAAQDGLGMELARLKEEEIRLHEERQQLEEQLQQSQESLHAQEYRASELQQLLEEQASTIEALQQVADRGQGPAELAELQQHLASAQQELAQLRQQAASSASEGGAGNEGALAQLRGLFMDVNDVVSGWRNSFMQVGNFLLDLQNGLEALRLADNPDKQRAALGDIERAGNIEEAQETLRGCEDDARRIKREMIRYRELLHG